MNSIITIITRVRSDQSFRHQIRGPVFLGLGAIVGAARLGTVASLVTAAAPSSFALVLLSGAAGIVFLARLVKLPLHPPSSAWRVPRRWRSLGLSRWAFIFGFALGTGLVTAISSGTFYVVLAACILFTPSVALVIMALYGLGRSLPMILSAVCIRTSGSTYTPDLPLDCAARLSQIRHPVAFAVTILNAFVLGAAARHLGREIIP